MDEKELLEKIGGYCAHSVDNAKRVMMFATRAIELHVAAANERTADKDLALRCAISMLDKKRVSADVVAMHNALILKGLCPPGRGASEIEKQVWQKIVAELKEQGYIETE